MLDLPTAPAAATAERRRQIEFLVREILAARERGDAPALLARLAPDFVYRAHGAWPMWPYHGGPIDAAQFADAARRLNAEIEFLGSDIHELLIDGDTVALHATSVARNRGAGAPVAFDQWMVFRFRDNLLVGMAIYVDAAKAALLPPSGLVEVHARFQPRRPAPDWLSGGNGDGRPARAVVADTPAPPGPDRGEARSRTFMERLVRDVFLLRAKGDFEGMLGRLAPDFVYNPRGAWTKPPLMADRCDRATFAESLRLVNVEFEDLGGEIHEFLVDGDRVAVHRTIRIRNRGAGDVVHLDEWVCFRICAGLIVEMASYVDSARASGVEWPTYAPPR